MATGVFLDLSNVVAAKVYGFSGKSPPPDDLTFVQRDDMDDIRVGQILPTEQGRAERLLKKDLAWRASIKREVRQRRAAGETALTVQDVIDELKAEFP